MKSLRPAAAQPGNCFQSRGTGQDSCQASPWRPSQVMLQVMRSTAASLLSSYLRDSPPQLLTQHTFLGFLSPECTFQIVNGLLQLGYRAFSKFSTGLRLSDRNKAVSATALQQRASARGHGVSYPSHLPSQAEASSPSWAILTWSLTSLSLSVRILISSSYLSSF